MIILKTEPMADGSNSIKAIQSLTKRFPGPHELRIDVGASKLNLGPQWTCSEAIIPALTEFGDADVLIDDEPRPEDRTTST